MVGMNTGREGMRRRYDTACFQKVVLSNGVTIWFQESPIEVDYATELVGFLPNVGSQLDPDDKPGTAHFFEHMPFRGTKNRPSTEAIQEPMRERGGEANATTAETWTSFYISGLSRQDLELGVETLCEMMFNPLLREEDVKIERDVVANHEYQDAVNDPDEARIIAMKREVFRGHPRSHRVLGEPQVIQAMTASQLSEFHRKYYHAANLHLVFGGSLGDSGAVLGVADKYFSGLSSGQVASNPHAPLPFGRSGVVQFVEPACASDTLVLVYPMETTWDHELLEFFAGMFSHGMTSPLMLELRNKRGMAYRHGQSKVWIYPDIRFFYTTFVTPASTFEEVGSIYRETLQNLSSDVVVRRQMERQYVRQSKFMHPAYACHDVIDEVVNFGKPSTHWEDEEHEDNLTLKDVFRLRDYLLDTEPLTLEILGG